MRKVVFLVAIIALTIFASRCNQAHAYSITSADTVVSAYITGEVITPSPTPIATPSGTLTPTPPLSPTPSPSVSPTPTPAYGGRFSLWGYTSPEAKVSVTNPGMYADTTADKGGYFEFRSFFSQQIVEDICLTAQDQAGRVTMPVCIPPIPSNENQSIGPVIMPPTISLNSDSFYTGDTVVVSGQTTPQTDVQLSLFTDESKTKLGSVRDSKPIAYRILMALEAARAWLSPVRPSYASTQPKQAAKVDRLGNFSVVVPSSDATYYRTFAQTIRNKDYSLKSITLNFDIFPGWFLIMKLLIGFFSGLKARFAEIVILSQVILIAYLLIRHFLQPHSIARMRSLAIMEHPLPVFTEHELVIREHEQRLDNLVRQKEALDQILGR